MVNGTFSVSCTWMRGMPSDGCFIWAWQNFYRSTVTVAQSQNCPKRHGANFSLSSEGHWKICFESDFDSYWVENNFKLNTGDILNIILDWILTGECQQEIVCGGYSAGPDRILPSKDLGLGPSPPHLHTCILSNLHTWTLAHLLESEEYIWTMNIFLYIFEHTCIVACILPNLQIVLKFFFERLQCKGYQSKTSTLMETSD